MMYQKSKEESLTRELFQNPTNEYRGGPFWAWNQALSPEVLVRHIDYFKEMGIGGFHMHCRTGLDTPYMGEEYKECVRACVEKAKAEGMYAYLYDEDRWPSGAAGGKVTKDVEYRSRYLVFTPFSNEERQKEELGFDSSSKAAVQGNGKLLARYDITLEDGCLKEYRRLEDGEQGTNVWYLYEEIARESPWYNNETYVDTLNPRAIERFIEETHEQYLGCVGDEFGKTVPSIFTDEPQFSHKTTLSFAESREDVILPYTDSLPAGYEAAYGENFFDTVPELIWDLPEEKVSVPRYRFHDFVAEQFSSSFADTIGNWCKDHGIMLTGHMMEEPTLTSQTNALGEAMRSYRSFQMPGIDMLCDWREYSTAKQAQSASHQYGCPGVLSELYGVTNWDFDFRGHKLAGDWQAALGVTLRVHHLSWDSMNGEAKRDYPASIFYQSPWYKEYGMIEDHFARVNTALTRGKAHVRVAVVHPIESYWLHYGPKEQTALIREELESRFSNVTEWLLFSQLDFDFVAESLLPDQYEASEDGKFHVGEMSYDVVLVPGNETLRNTTVSSLKSFREKGGDVLFMGDAPALVDARPSEEGKELYGKCRHIGFSRSALVKALDAYRDVELRTAAGNLSEQLIYQMREDGDIRWLFVCNGRKMQNPDIPKKDSITFRLKGSWEVEEYDTMTGEIRPVSVERTNNMTSFIHNMYDHSSVLLKLIPAAESQRTAESAADGEYTMEEGIHLASRMPYRLSEPNVLLMDMAEYRFDGGEWMEREEILRLDNVCREIAGYPLRMEAFAQPWTSEKSAPEHTLELRFAIDSEIEVEDAFLALEEMNATSIWLNGKEVKKPQAGAAGQADVPEDSGYFVDECIRKVALPHIPVGRSELLLKISYSRNTNVEWYYLLGSFGVKVTGSRAVLTPLPEQIAFGDYVDQGFPFYAGNMIYETEITVEEAGEYIIAAEKFRAPLLKVLIDGKQAGRIALAPYQVQLGYLEKGKHAITIISYGNRVNAFGTVHACNEYEHWVGPNAWRTTGAGFSYEYQLKRMGVLAAPRVFLVK